MADNQEPTPESAGENAPKLPPRSGDWQSGLRKAEERPRPDGGTGAGSGAGSDPAASDSRPATAFPKKTDDSHDHDWDPVGPADRSPGSPAESEFAPPHEPARGPLPQSEITQADIRAHDRAAVAAGAAAGAAAASAVSPSSTTAEVPASGTRSTKAGNVTSSTSSTPTHETDTMTNDTPLTPPPGRPRRTTLAYYERPGRITDWLLALLLGVLAFAAVALTYRGIGHSWDEALYLKPAKSAAAWMMGVINSGDDSMLRKESIDRQWGQRLDANDPLHPEVAPVPKLLPGAGITYLQKPLQVDEMTAMRLPNAILFGLTVALLFLIGTWEYGRIGGFAAALFYVLLPRVFGHAHIAASETPLAFFTVLTVWCFLVANRFWPFALFTAIALALAINTKVTALALPIPLMIWGQLYRRRDYASNAFAMILIAPVIAVALWPWLWYDTFHRVVAYLEFYLAHQKTAVYYLGNTWGYNKGPVAPFYYPLHITALVIPVWMLFFLAVGVLRAIFSTVRRPVTILFIFLAVFWIGLAMLPGAPRYDGERLWFPAFAFLTLLAAGGFAGIFTAVHHWRERRASLRADHDTSFAATIALLVIGVYGTGDLIVTHPNELNYYNWLTGRTRGAYAAGFETSYWGEAVNEDVLSFLNKTLKPGDKVKTLALSEEVFDNLRQWDKLPRNVDFSPLEPPYDYAIMQVRQGFMGPLERRIWKTKKPLKSFDANGVPRILIYDGKTLTDVFPVTTGTVTTPSATAGAAAPTPANAGVETALPTAETPTSATLKTAPAITPVGNDMTTAAATRGREMPTTATESQAHAGAPSADQTTSTQVLALPTTESAHLQSPAPPEALPPAPDTVAGETETSSTTPDQASPGAPAAALPSAAPGAAPNLRQSPAQDLAPAEPLKNVSLEQTISTPTEVLAPGLPESAKNQDSTTATAVYQDELPTTSTTGTAP